MGTEAAAGTGLFLNHGFEFLQSNGPVFKGTLVITGSTQVYFLPAETGKFVDHGKAHAGLFHGNFGQRSGGTDSHTFHAQVAGNTFYGNKRCPGMDAGADIKGSDGVKGTDFNTATTADTFSGKNVFSNCTRWSQTVGGYRRF